MTLETGPSQNKPRKLSFSFLRNSKALLLKPSRFTDPLQEAQLGQQPLRSLADRENCR